MNDEQRAQLQREMGQAFYADVLKLEHENAKLRAAAMDAARERDEALAEVAAHEAEARKHFERAEDEARSLELAKDELATLTVRFDETAKELRLVEAREEGLRDAVKMLRASVLRLRSRSVRARALLMDETRAPALMASEAVVILDPIDDAHIVDDAATMRQAAYELVEREWAELHVMQAIRLPGEAPDWYVNGCGLGRTLFSAVEKWRELQQQKGDKEP